jgi:TRAP-type C4-dicarboxylate transport system permease large subunit
LLVINLLFLVLGCFLDTLLMLLVIVPIAMPSIRAVGIDPVHFGVTTVVNLMIGMITPPYSELLFVVTGITGIPLTSMYRHIWGFIAALVLVLLVLLGQPKLVLWLPIQFGYQPAG